MLVTAHCRSVPPPARVARRKRNLWKTDTRAISRKWRRLRIYWLKKQDRHWRRLQGHSLSIRAKGWRWGWCFCQILGNRDTQSKRPTNQTAIKNQNAKGAMRRNLVEQAIIKQLASNYSMRRNLVEQAIINLITRPMDSLNPLLHITMWLPPPR